MKTLLLSAALLFLASSNLQATEALIFDGGGHNLYILVGMTDQPNIAQVRYTAPGAKEWVSVPRESVEVKKFDMKQKSLQMRFENKKKDPALPPTFSLSVKKDKAVLTINGKQIKSSFDWLDE
ncbi:MAG: hypothetical protein QOH88_1550 [Verrucomicrobiota bacterium]|jgi:hypothetical protein